MADEKIDPLKQAFDFFLNKPTADPAQSAPSAEAALTSAKLIAGMKVFEHSAMKAGTMALVADGELKSFCDMLNEIAELRARAETAESALRDARGRIEKDVQMLNVCYGFISQVWSANPLDSPNEKSCHALLVLVNKELTEARALLTVAAQTPEEK